ncbi:MAG: hypothetical protein HPY74_19680 [Firmicutes bacterium]|nr:hypothetical protein [Bacillota bacterium]
MKDDKLKEKLHQKLEEAINAIIVLGKQNFFKIHLQNINGDILISIEYTDKDKVEK